MDRKKINSIMAKRNNILETLTYIIDFFQRHKIPYALIGAMALNIYGRPRDFEDAVTVLERLSGNIDIPYIKRWAKRLGIVEELNYILNL